MGDEDVEQRFSDLEREFVALRREHGSVKAEKEALSGENEALRKQVEQLRAEAETREKTAAAAAATLRQKDVRADALEGDAKSAAERAERMALEVDRLKDELAARSRECASMSDSASSARESAARSEAATVQLQYDLERAQKGREALETHNAWLDKELKTKTEELIELRATRGREAVDLEARARDAEAKAQSEAKRLADATELLAERDRALEAVRADLQAVRAESAAEKAAFEGELAAQRGLAELHKTHMKEFEARCERLRASNEELGGNLKELERQSAEAMASAREHAARELEEAKAAFAQREKALTERLGRERKEREDEDEARRAAAGATALESGVRVLSGNMNITEVYEAYEQADAEAKRLGGEKERLEMYISRILKDIEAKAPVLAAQKREYQRVLQSYASLSERFDGAAKELEEQRASAAAAQAEREAMVEENAALRQEVGDVSLQLRALLRRQMEAKRGEGGAAASTAVAVVPDGSSGERLTAADVISTHLVAFEDVDELQKKNAQLLRVVRKLTREQEAEGQARLEAAETSDRAALREALAQLEALKGARVRHEAMMKEIVKQRDTYRLCLAQADMRFAAPEGSKAAIASPEARLRLAAQDVAGEAREKELEELREQLQASREANKVQAEQVEELRKVRRCRDAPPRAPVDAAPYLGRYRPVPRSMPPRARRERAQQLSATPERKV